MSNYKCSYGKNCECKTDEKKSTCDLAFETKTKMSKEELIEEILDIINSENSGLSHQQRLNEIEGLLNQNKDE